MLSGKDEATMSMATPEGSLNLGPGRDVLVWYRPSIRGRVYKAWAQAFGFIMSGAVVLGGLRVERIDFGSPWLPLYIVGMLLVMSGPLWLATRLARMMRSERVLCLRRDGLTWMEGEAVTMAFRWSEIDKVELSDGGIVIQGERRRLELPSQFEDISPSALVQMIQGLRRRSLMGMPMRVDAGR